MYMLKTTGQKLVHLSVCPKGHRQHKKDIDGFVKVLQVPLYAPEVVSQLVGGPVDFLPCGCGRVLKELCPSLKQPLGSVDSFLYLSVIKVERRSVTDDMFHKQVPA